MDIANKQSFWMVVIIILAALNIGLMAFVWFDRMPPRMDHPPAGMPPGGPHGDDFMIQELGLRGEQAQAIRTLHEEQVLRGDTIKAELSRLYTEIVDELFSPAPDSSRIRQLSDAIGGQQAKFEWRSFETFLEIKRLCNPDQQRKLKLLVIEILQKSLMSPSHSNLDRSGFQPPPSDMPPPAPSPGDPRGKDHRGP
jgi:periplasmic protein CpxP/Spy